MLWDAVIGHGSTRADWAEAIRAPVRNHPRAWQFTQSKARKRYCCANRRAGKTENPGREILARAIENDGFICWVFAGDLGEYSRNWLDRRPNGAVRLLEQLGMPRGSYRVTRQVGHVRRIEFPQWESVIEVFSAKDEAQIDKARGGRLSVLVLDEAQKLELITKILLDIAGPAGADFEAEVWMTGTPGDEIDSLFYRIGQGEVAGWDVHRYYSWDNTFFGETWRERYHRAVYSTLVEFADEYQCSPEQLEWLRDIGEETALAIEDHPLGKSLPDRVKRELFGVWAALRAGLVFALSDTPSAYWGVWADGITTKARGEGDERDLMDEPEWWQARIEALPKRMLRGRPVAKRWYAVVGVDLGFWPDPTALVVWLYSPEDPAIYELGSGKALELGEDVQRAVLEHWVGSLEALYVDVSAVIVDSSGGEAASVSKSWGARLRQRFGVPVYPAEKYQTAKPRQLWMMNADIRAGRMMFLADSPLALEAQHLAWRLVQTERRRKAEIHKHREVALPGGVRAVLGDHCCDAARYAWYWARHIDGAEPGDSPAQTAIQRMAERANRAEWG